MIGWRNYAANDLQCRQHANMPLVEHEPTLTHFAVPRLIVPRGGESAAATLYQFDKVESPIPSSATLDLHIQQIIEAVNERRAYIANPASGLQHFGYTDAEWQAGWSPVSLDRAAWTHSKNLLDWLRDLIWQDGSDFCIGKWLGGHLVASPYGDGDFRMPFASETEMLDEAVNQAEDSSVLAALAPAGSGKYITIPARIATTSTPARNDRRFSDFDGFIPMCREHIDALFAVLNTLNGYAFQRLAKSMRYSGHGQYPGPEEPELGWYASYLAAHARMDYSYRTPDELQMPYGSAGGTADNSSPRWASADREDYISTLDANWICVYDKHVTISSDATLSGRFVGTVDDLPIPNPVPQSDFYLYDGYYYSSYLRLSVSLYRQLAADQFVYKWPA
jgi:hypothetical protein